MLEKFITQFIQITGVPYDHITERHCVWARTVTDLMYKLNRMSGFNSVVNIAS